MAVRFERATVGDIIACLLIPFWGAVIGFAAVIRGEKKRGLTMIAIGMVWLAALFILSQP